MSYDFRQVLDFWFKEISPQQWWTKDNEFDSILKQKFSPLHAAAARGELWSWRTLAEGRLAEVLVLDQFSRNIYRDLPESFAFDGIALVLAQEAISRREDQKLSVEHRRFLYMPFMHSESSPIHEEAVRLFSQPGLEDNLDFEIRHKKIIDRFGRYPHRNRILGRKSTPEEIEFLTQPGSSF